MLKLQSLSERISGAKVFLKHPSMLESLAEVGDTLLMWTILSYVGYCKHVCLLGRPDTYLCVMVLL